MKDMKVVDVLNITLEEAVLFYETYGMGFIIKDGKLKGFNVNR